VSDAADLGEPIFKPLKLGSLSEVREGKSEEEEEIGGKVGAGKAEARGRAKVSMTVAMEARK
jgi:hypothetical protein